MILVRHGQSQFNVAFAATRKDPGIPDPVLTELGHIQAEQAGQALAARQVRRIVSSPYTRALQTARAASRFLEASVEIDARCGERGFWMCDLGSPTPELAQQFPEMTFDHLPDAWWPPPPETEDAFHSRCAAFALHARSWPDLDAVAVICHWGVIAALTGRQAGNGELVPFDPRRWNGQCHALQG